MSLAPAFVVYCKRAERGAMNEAMKRFREERQRRRDREFGEDWEKVPVPDDGSVNVDETPDAAAGMEPWTITVLDPLTGVETLVTSRRLFDLWLAGEGRELGLEGFLQMPQAQYARNTFPWLEELYAATGI